MVAHELPTKLKLGLLGATSRIIDAASETSYQEWRYGDPRHAPFPPHGDTPLGRVVRGIRPSPCSGPKPGDLWLCPGRYGIRLQPDPPRLVPESMPGRRPSTCAISGASWVTSAWASTTPRSWTSMSSPTSSHRDPAQPWRPGPPGRGQSPAHPGLRGLLRAPVKREVQHRRRVLVRIHLEHGRAGPVLIEADRLRNGEPPFHPRSGCDDRKRAAMGTPGELHQRVHGERHPDPLHLQIQLLLDARGEVGSGRPDGGRMPSLLRWIGLHTDFVQIIKEPPRRISDLAILGSAASASRQDARGEDRHRHPLGVALTSNTSRTSPSGVPPFPKLLSANRATPSAPTTRAVEARVP